MTLMGKFYIILIQSLAIGVSVGFATQEFIWGAATFTAAISLANWITILNQ